MNNKILMADLASALSRRSGLPKKDSESFVRSFFDILEQYLFDDKIVKIKGLGTFKIIEVSGRDSVDVNTGERIHIKGHSKISFTPDTSLRNSINHPFADFETVILNEGVDLEAMSFVGTADSLPNLDMEETVPVTVKTDAEEHVGEEPVYTNAIPLDTLFDDVPEDHKVPRTGLSSSVPVADAVTPLSAVAANSEAPELSSQEADKDASTSEFEKDADVEVNADSEEETVVEQEEATVMSEDETLVEPEDETLVEPEDDTVTEPEDEPLVDQEDEPLVDQNDEPLVDQEDEPLVGQEDEVEPAEETEVEDNAVAEQDAASEIEQEAVASKSEEEMEVNTESEIEMSPLEETAEQTLPSQEESVQTATENHSSVDAEKQSSHHRHHSSSPSSPRYVASHRHHPLAESSDFYLSGDSRHHSRHIGSYIAKTLAVLILMAFGYWAGSTHLLQFLLEQPEKAETTKGVWGVSYDQASLDADSLRDTNTATEAAQPVKDEQNAVAAEAQPAKAASQSTKAEAKPVVAEVQPTKSQAKSTRNEAKSASSETKPTKAETKPTKAEAKPTKAESKSTKAESKSTKSATKADAANYPQVEGGAYSIVGVKCTHTVTFNDNLSAIARKYLGSDQLVIYIIRMNNIANPDIICGGQQLKIPELRSK